MAKLDELLNLETFQVGEQTFESDLAENLEINSSNLNEEFAKQGRLMATYGFAYELALKHESKLQVAMEKVYALVDARERNTAQTEGRKLTEKMVENLVITSQEYQEIQNAYLEAKASTGLLKAAKDAIIHRKDSLISMGAIARAEMQADPTMRYQR